ncbi:hypothetical protein OOT55_02645 [Marinimicrobium sp. C6131]|uniref:hypothetical protein n=1 Tax=Marinimicrobium sp. C6131 TaxID=3022676 RepID=UPI00223E05BC|nr:hypothetical protein [Marinimicrobium sp. C6131]UZJ44972.1 hypothetical protein OOT55_02645 [Marinimicrobium sp. C6131]
MKQLIKLFQAGFIALVLSACGSEGGTSSPTPESTFEDQSETETDTPTDDPEPNNPSEEPPPEQEVLVYHIGGTSVGIDNLDEPVILQINDSENVEIFSDGSFMFPTGLPEGTEYKVSITAAPLSPGGLPRCSLMGSQGLTQNGSGNVLNLRCISNFFAEGEFSEDGLTLSWTSIEAPHYAAYAMPVGISDTSNYAAYPDAEMVPNVSIALKTLENFNLGEKDFIIEADFGDGHRFRTDPITELNATPLGGIIYSDQLLNENQSPYKAYEDVQVAHNTTVNIQPGVNLEGDNRNFSVFGIFKVEGAPNNNVRINNLHIVPGNNSTSDPPFKIDLTFLSLRGGSLYYPTGNAIYGTLILTDSVIEGIPYVHLWYPVDDVTIARNIFIDTGGLSIGLSTGVNATVENNVFIRNQGSSTSSGYAVQSWATYDSSVLTVSKNSFLSTDRIAVELRPGHSNASMDARENYWGTTDEGIIESMIYDINDDLSATDQIPYTPYLSEPHPDTPATESE